MENRIIEKYSDEILDVLLLQAFDDCAEAERNGESFEQFKARKLRQINPCSRCGQIDRGQTGEYPCEECGLPALHDE